MSGRSLCFATLAAVLVWVGSGCGGGGPKLHKVNGKVTLDGQPLSGADIEFEPLDYSTGLQPAYGKTGQDGSYSLTTSVTGDGAMAGDYKVTITKLPEVKGGIERPANLGADGKGAADMGALMQKAAQAGKAGSSGPATPKSEVHPDYSSREKTILKMTVPPPGGHADFALKKGGGS